MKSYKNELNFIKKAMLDGYNKYCDIKITLIDKADYDIVTELDYNIEKYISAEIMKAFPDDRIMGEEHSAGVEVVGRTWTIDPIDGTNNMANGIPLFGVQCSLFDGEKPVVAAIYLPFCDEMFTASAGSGAYLNGKQIHVAKPDLKHCVVSFGDYPHTRPNESAIQLKIMAHLSDKVARIRMFGAASIDYAYVAAGRTHGVVIYTKNKWDIAPGILLCLEAGAKVYSLDTEDGEYNYDSPSVILTSTEELYQCIRSH